MNLLSSIDATELPVTALDGDELWYKDAIIYQLHVKAFADRDRKSTRLNSSHIQKSRMPSSA